MWITFLKRLIASIGMILSYFTMTSGFSEFRSADTDIEFFRGLFYGLIGVIALILFLRDFIRKKWPLDGLGD